MLICMCLKGNKFNHFKKEGNLYKKTTEVLSNKNVKRFNDCLSTEN